MPRRSFDSLGNLYNCAGGWANNCKEMLTSMSYDQIELCSGARERALKEPECVKDASCDAYNCVENSTSLWVMYRYAPTLNS